MDCRGGITLAKANRHVDRGAREAARFGINRNSEWPKVEKQHLKIQPHCMACKSGTKVHGELQVHHIFPFHYCVALGRPDLELDQRNLITLCENKKDRHGLDHHLLIGHLDDFQSSNLDVVKDARTTFYSMSAENIRKDPRWEKKEKTKLKPLDTMSQREKNAFTANMNSRFPKNDA